MTPEAYADKLAKWAKVGFNFDMIEDARKSLEVDAADGRRDAPKKKGYLAASIHVTRPSVARAAKTGQVSLSVVAGSRSVPYAGVLLRGLVGWPGHPKTRPHDIIAHAAGTWIAHFGRRKPSYGQATGKVLTFKIGGQTFFRRKVHHPGSDFSRVRKNWLKINQVRLEASIDRGLEASARREGVA
jgi:hypothetical protein